MTFETGDEIMQFLVSDAEKRGVTKTCEQARMMGVSHATLYRSALKGLRTPTKSGNRQGLSENLLREACRKMGFRLRLVVEKE